MLCSVTRVVEYVKWSQQGEPGQTGLPKATFLELMRVAVARGMVGSRVSHVDMLAASSKIAQWSIQSGIPRFCE